VSARPAVEAFTDSLTVTVAGAVQLSEAVAVNAAQPGKFWHA
jgi:hypothetical protein